MNENPVILPPGCARFEMNPWPTGSTAIATTIGTVLVAGRRAATTALECATITSGASLITSATCLLIDSSLVPANRYSIWTLRPSTHPRSRMPNRNALTRLFVSGSFSSRPSSMLTRRTCCDPCAHAASGDAAAAPPRRPMNSRRFTDTPRLKQQMVSTLTCTEAGVGHCALLLDQLVSKPKQRRRHRKAERLGGREVDH